MGLSGPVGLPAEYREASGNLASPNNVEEAINNAIGQGNVQVTAVQMAFSVAAVANGGTLWQPFIVQRVGGADGAPVTFEAQPSIVGELGLEAETMQIIHEGMCDVVSDQERGTARSAFWNIPYTACGKTGTSQTSRIEPHAWFVVYAPADNPQIAVVVVAEHSREGSEVAAPIARRILDYYFGAPQAPWPDWWLEDYVELISPSGGTPGG